MMIIDSIIYLAIWYLLISLVGWLTFPLAYRLLPNLPDRGYAFSRILGLLLWGFFFWLLASLGVLYNDSGSILFALALIVLLSLWAIRNLNRSEIKAWWDSQRGMVFTVEILFLIAFIVMAFIRAANPEIEGTEKPMELAFINAILGSPTFPPHDPWLSGYAISYYYFGYVLVAMMAKLTGVPGNFAFNLGIAMVFALSAVGSYGVVYNLLKRRTQEASSNAKAYAMLGPLFVLIVSNLEGFLHSLHSRGLFWTRNAVGELTSSFWSWIDIKDLNLPPMEPLTWIPAKHWWWWRASRVLQDYNYLDHPLEIIDEFPFFSFLLGDLHPHVIAIPFAFLVIALALNIFYSSTDQHPGALRIHINQRTLAWILVIVLFVSLALLIYGLLVLSIGSVTIGLMGLVFTIAGFWYLSPNIAQNGLRIFVMGDLDSIRFDSGLEINWPTLLLAGIIVGGMAFLNIWDIMVAVALVAGAYALGRIYKDRAPTITHFVKDFILMSLVLGILSIILYLPFFLGFSSQAGGPLPNLIFPTRGAHLWVMFAPLFLPIFVYLFYLWRKKTNASQLKKSILISTSFILALWVISFILGFIIVNLPEIGGIEVGNFYLNFLGAPDSASLFSEAILRRFTSPGGWITLVLLLIATIGLLLRLLTRNSEANNHHPASNGSPFPKADSFVLLLILVGTVLLLGVEFIYLRDQFGWRMNTIFKFYYEVWLLLSIAAAYGVAVLLQKLHTPWSIIFRLGVVCILVMSIFYPVMSLWNKTYGFQPANGWTLDGTAFLDSRSPEEMQAIKWLQSAPPGVLAEAVSPTGGSYQWPPGYARVSTLSGMPAVLGWMGHESQWRGGDEEMGSRQPDIERLYCSRNFDEVSEILERYNIRYVYVGPLELSTYRPNEGACPTGIIEAKFETALELAFRNGQVRIYEVPGYEN